jgi:hypothetical protein
MDRFRARNLTRGISHLCLLLEGGSDIIPTKILVGTDGSEESLSAIPTAAKIAKETGSQLHVAWCVSRQPPPSYPHPSLAIERSGALLERRQLEGLMQLDELAGRIEDQGMSVAGVSSRRLRGRASRTTSSSRRSAVPGRRRSSASSGRT